MKSLQVDFNRLDFTLLRRGCLIALIVLILPVAVFLWIYANYLSLKSAEDNLNRQYLNASRELHNAKALASKIDTYQMRYKELVDKSYFTDGTKIKWLEKIKVMASELGLSQIDYSIGGAKSAGVEHLEVARVVFDAIPVSLEMAVMHEVDLIRLLDKMKSLRLGLVRNDGCSLERTRTLSDFNSGNYNFMAQCNLSSIEVAFQ